MSRDQISGAKWWKFDFHTHTPASDDYENGPLQETLKKRSQREWLLDFMRNEIDCVAVTDHNSGVWVDQLKNELSKMEQEKIEGFMPLYIFPGVEISVNGGIHILAIFDLKTSSQDIAGLLGAVGFTGSHGKTDDCTSKTVPEVISEIVKRKGIAIPAHVDIQNGLFTVQGVEGQGPTLIKSLSSEGLLALELHDPNMLKPQIYTDLKLQLAEVVASDSHRPDEVGCRYTWVKMESPTIDALRLALHDGEDGIRRFDTFIGNPNNHSGRFFIKKITVTEGKKAGRGFPMAITFSPWMTTLIGGRGSGKSSVLDYLRIALNGGEGLPDKIKKDYEEFAQVSNERGKPGMLTKSTEIRVDMVKEGREVALIWKEKSWREEHRNKTGDWEDKGDPGDIAGRFPVRMFSQKQLYEMTEDPHVLLNLIDGQLDKASWQEKRRKLHTEWMESRRKERELKQMLFTQVNVTAELGDVSAKMKIFEESEHNQVLTDYQLCQKTKQGLDATSSNLEYFINYLEEAVCKIPNLIIDGELRTQIGPDSTTLIDNQSKAWQALRKQFIDFLDKIFVFEDSWEKQLLSIPWQAKYQESIEKYQTLVEKLEKAGEDDPTGYSQLVEKKQDFELKLARVEGYRSSLVLQEKESERLRAEIIACEKELREMRKQVVQNWNQPDFQQDIRVILEIMGNDRQAEVSLRELIRKPGIEYAKELGERDENGVLIGGFLHQIESRIDEEQRWKIREEFLARLSVATDNNPNGFSKPIARHIDALRKKSPEDIDKMLVWVPEDRVILRLVENGHEKNIEVGSAGQRTAGMLSLLLRLSDTPLIIDQPEDDLDNRHISNLVVSGLRALKNKQQVIVVTHNPNIPVNGGAEQIVIMEFAGGQICSSLSGALQKNSIRTAVCEVMEGGRVALANRYYRIAQALTATEKNG